jgi:hypothetical protein
MRWVEQLTPEVRQGLESRCYCNRSVVASRRHIREGVWQKRGYVCRVVRRPEKAIHFRLIAKRDVAAARAFFAKAIKSQGRAPKTITLDRHAAFHRAVHKVKTDGLLPKDTTLHSSKCLNNLIEEGYRAQIPSWGLSTARDNWLATKGPATRCKRTSYRYAGRRRPIHFDFPTHSSSPDQSNLIEVFPPRRVWGCEIRRKRRSRCYRICIVSSSQSKIL